MKIDIYTSRVPTKEHQKPRVGIEIVPPQPDYVLTGLSEALVDKPKEGSYTTGRDHDVEKVHITRNDANGSALVVETNHYTDPVPEAIGACVATLLSPAGQHQVTVHPPAATSSKLL